MYVGMRVLILRMKNIRNVAPSIPRSLQLLEEVEATIVERKEVPGNDGEMNGYYGYRAVAEDGTQWGLHFDTYPSWEMDPVKNWYNLNETLQCIDIYEDIVNLDAVYAMRLSETIPVLGLDGARYVANPEFVGCCTKHESGPIYYHASDLESKKRYATLCVLCAGKLPNMGHHRLRVGS